LKSIVCIVVFVLAWSSHFAQKTFPLKSEHRINKKLIDIQVTGIDGTTFPLADIVKKNKNYVISIMASWCGPCRTELSAFQKVKDKWAAELNTEILAISIEKPSDTYKLFDLVKKQQWTIQVVHDKMAYTSRELGVFDIPQTFLVNQFGDIVYSTEGYQSNLISLYKSEIEKLQ